MNINQNKVDQTGPPCCSPALKTGLSALNARGGPYHWPLISEEDQDRYLQRHVGAVRFSEEMTDPVAGEQARREYVGSDPEQPMLAYVMSENNQWLADLAQRGAEAESDKYEMMASVNLANCIAYADAQSKPAELLAN